MDLNHDEIVIRSNLTTASKIRTHICAHACWLDHGVLQNVVILLVSTPDCDAVLCACWAVPAACIVPLGV